MPKFLDVHPLNGVDEESLRKFQNAPVDEYQVKAVNLMYNYEADRFYCLLEAPNKQAIKDHHNKYGFECESELSIKAEQLDGEEAPIRLCKLSSLDDYVRIEITDESEVVEDEMKAEYIFA